jgi:hypothetical protein
VHENTTLVLHCFIGFQFQVADQNTLFHMLLLVQSTPNTFAIIRAEPCVYRPIITPPNNNGAFNHSFVQLRIFATAHHVHTTWVFSVSCPSAVHHAHRSTRVARILMSSSGLSSLFVGARPMRATTFMPAYTRPKIVCFPAHDKLTCRFLRNYYLTTRKR